MMIWTYWHAATFDAKKANDMCHASLLVYCENLINIIYTRNHHIYINVIKVSFLIS